MSANGDDDDDYNGGGAAARKRAPGEAFFVFFSSVCVPVCPTHMYVHVCACECAYLRVFSCV